MRANEERRAAVQYNIWQNGNNRKVSIAFTQHWDVAGWWSRPLRLQSTTPQDRAVSGVMVCRVGESQRAREEGLLFSGNDWLVGPGGRRKLPMRTVRPQPRLRNYDFHPGADKFLRFHFRTTAANFCQRSTFLKLIGFYFDDDEYGCYGTRLIFTTSSTLSTRQLCVLSPNDIRLNIRLLRRVMYIYNLLKNSLLSAKETKLKLDVDEAL